MSTTKQSETFVYGEQVATVTINRRLWKGALRELRSLGYVERSEGKGARKKHHIAKDVPGKDALRQEAIDRLYTHTLQDALSLGLGELESLQDEMTEWRDNLDGGGLGATPKFEEVSECADTLEEAHGELEDLDLTGDNFAGIVVEDVALKDHKVVVGAPGTKVPSSRQDRLYEALAYLDAVRDALTTIVDEEAHADNDDLIAARDLVENTYSTLEDVSFPGMF